MKGSRTLLRKVLPEREEEVDHGTICGRNCANSGHYKPLCACVDRTKFVRAGVRAGPEFFLEAPVWRSNSAQAGRGPQWPIHRISAPARCRSSTPNARARNVSNPLLLTPSARVRCGRRSPFFGVGHRVLGKLRFSRHAGGDLMSIRFDHHRHAHAAIVLAVPSAVFLGTVSQCLVKA
jgi:hypothetical protein